MRLRRLCFVVIAAALMLRGADGPFAWSHADACPREGHDCCQMLRVSCCSDDEAPAAPVAPPATQQAAPSPSVVSLVSDVLTGTTTADPGPVLVAWAPTPTHDMRRLDLSVFLSVFLI